MSTQRRPARFSRLYQLHLIAKADRAWAHDIGVERQPAAEAPADVTQHFRIAFQRIGIDRRHRAARAQRLETHDYAGANMQFRAWPFALVEASNAANQDVRTKAPHVAPERGYRAVRRHQPRQNIEAIALLRRLQPRIVTRRAPDTRERRRTLPRMTVDERVSFLTPCAAQTQQPVMPPRGTHPFRTENANDAVPGDTVESNFSHGQRLARQALNGIAPQTCDVQTHVLSMPPKARCDMSHSARAGI